MTSLSCKPFEFGTQSWNPISLSPTGLCTVSLEGWWPSLTFSLIIRYWSEDSPTTGKVGSQGTGAGEKGSEIERITRGTASRKRT